MEKKKEKDTQNTKNDDKFNKKYLCGDIDDFIFQHQEIKKHSERQVL